MKIIIRLPHEAFEFSEIHYDSIEEYQDNHLRFVQAIEEVKIKIKNAPPKFNEVRYNSEPLNPPIKTPY